MKRITTTILLLAFYMTTLLPFVISTIFSKQDVITTVVLIVWILISITTCFAADASVLIVELYIIMVMCVITIQVISPHDMAILIGPVTTAIVWIIRMMLNII